MHTREIRVRIGCGRSPLPAWALRLALVVPAMAGATDFPFSGTISIDGRSGVLGGGEFFGSSYDPATGTIAPGVFLFPQAQTRFDSPLGSLVVDYQLIQEDTSSGQVGMDGAAAMTATTLRLQVLSAIAGDKVYPVGDFCFFEPVGMLLTGSAAAAGLDLADAQFIIPPTDPSACGGYAIDIGQGIAGSDNSIALHLDGDFAPPRGDLVFRNGFDSADRL